MPDNYKEIAPGLVASRNEDWWYAFCDARGVSAAAVDAGTASLDTRGGAAVFPRITRGPAYALPVATDASGSLFVIGPELAALHGLPVTVQGQGHVVSSAPDSPPPAAKWAAKLQGP